MAASISCRTSAPATSAAAGFGAAACAAASKSTPHYGDSGKCKNSMALTKIARYGFQNQQSHTNINDFFMGTKGNSTALIKELTRRNNLNKLYQVDKNGNDAIKLYRSDGTFSYLRSTDRCIHSRISDTHAPQPLPRSTRLLVTCTTILKLIFVQHHCHIIRNFVFFNT
uniref:Uncharacterized protein n=1 Tax=Bactrocera dorsalis TaxID=27457 RepID=A0A034VUJ8_BACDO